MAEVKVSGIIHAGVDQVWELVSNFSRLDEFVEAVVDCTAEGSGTGAVRTLTLADGGEAKEQLESLHPDQHLLTYSIIDSPMPIENYSGSMQVKRITDGKSEFTWSSTFDVQDGTEREMKEALEGLYKLGVEGLQQRFSD
ncbi:MAG: SRPBCC family protein [Fodinibius sp.]|nr:SRPBCC family protein [Fodinibius sp.]